MATGYCTLEDLRHALQEKDLPGDLEQDKNIAIAAIAGREQWLRSQIDGHFYDGDGSATDKYDLLPTEAKTRGPEFLDIPSTPHSQHDTLFHSRSSRQPLRMVGPYTKVKLQKQYATDIQTLKVRDASGDFEDWTATDSDKTQGEGGEFELISGAGSTSSESYLLLDTRTLPALNRYDEAVRVTYDYGLDSVPMDIRRAVANAAASDFVEDAAIQIPNNAEVYGVESLADQFERKADELLEAYR